MRQFAARSAALGSLLLAAGGATAQVVSDGSFEAGTPNPFWTEFSTNFVTPLCDGSCIGVGAPSEARTGMWWAWFGGIDTVPEMGTLSQTVMILAGSPTLEFYLVGGTTVGNTNNDYLRVFIDSTQVFEITDDTLQDPNSPYTMDWTLVSVDLSQFAGGTHELRFESMTQGNGFLANFWVDDVSIGTGGTGGCYPNCDLSTTPPILNVADFTCFLQQFAAGASYANCDMSTTPPVLNVADFTCFLQQFAAGCP